MEEKQKQKPVVQEEHSQDLVPSEASIFFFVHVLNSEVQIQNEAEIDYAKVIQVGVISPQVIDQLLNTMNSVFTPWIESCQAWPLSVKNEFKNQLERYLSSVTEVSNLQRGRTVLYIPQFKGNTEDNSSNKDDIPRLETLVVHWTRQIKELISGVHAGNQDDATELVQQVEHGYEPFPLLPNPLSEIDYWTRRSEDLDQVSIQLSCESL